VALVSDAGTPGIADPGYHLVRGALAAGIPVVPVPGASAVATIVSVAGLAAERFVFEGFLPHRALARKARLAELAREPRAMVFLEAARRLESFLEDALAALGDRSVVVGRELTKRHEELMRGTLAELRREVASREVLRGEVTVLVAGAPERVVDEAVDVDAEIRAGRAAGRPLRELTADIARRAGLARRDVYRRALELDRG
jgi:16S rRNA (cytidine1402-2'-O)-methyltransferase